MSTSVSSDLLSREQAAEFLGLRPQTLSVWASTKRYPLPFVKIGSRVKYRLSDLQRFVESRVVGESP
jgi:predicted DNA-binding transcriptional regulator AlpA